MVYIFCRRDRWKSFTCIYENTKFKISKSDIRYRKKIKRTHTFFAALKTNMWPSLLSFSAKNCSIKVILLISITDTTHYNVECLGSFEMNYFFNDFYRFFFYETMYFFKDILNRHSLVVLYFFCDILCFLN